MRFFISFIPILQATGGAMVNTLPAAMASPPIQQVPQLQSNTAVVQTVGTITMVTCGGSLNTMVVSMQSGGIASQPTLPG